MKTGHSQLGSLLGKSTSMNPLRSLIDQLINWAFIQPICKILLRTIKAINKFAPPSYWALSFQNTHLYSQVLLLHTTHLPTHHLWNALHLSHRLQIPTLLSLISYQCIWKPYFLVCLFLLLLCLYLYLWIVFYLLVMFCPWVWPETVYKTKLKGELQYFAH